MNLLGSLYSNLDRNSYWELRYTPGREGMGWVLSPTGNQCYLVITIMNVILLQNSWEELGKNELQGLLQSSPTTLSYTKLGVQWNPI